MKRLLSFSFISVLMVLAVSCGSKPEEQVKEFAGKFGDFVNTNQKDSVQKYYPAFQLTDSLATLPLSNIIVSPEETDGQYIIEFSPQTQVLAKLDEQGKISIVDSKGLLAFPEKDLELLNKAGLWNENLNDLELSKLITEENEKREKILAAMPVPSLFINSYNELEGIDQVSKKLLSLGYVKTGGDKKEKKTNVDVEGKQTASFVLNPDGEPNVKIEMELKWFEDLEYGYGGGGYDIKLIFSDLNDAKKFQNEFNSKPHSSFVQSQRTGNEVKLSTYYD